MDRTALEKMLEQGTDNAMLRYTLGSLLLREGRAEEALAHLRRAIELDANHSASWKLLGKALSAAGKTEEAVAAYRKGIGVAEARGDVQTVREMQVFLKRLLKSGSGDTQH